MMPTSCLSGGVGLFWGCVLAVAKSEIKYNVIQPDFAILMQTKNPTFMEYHVAIRSRYPSQHLTQTMSALNHATEQTTCR